MPHSPHPFSNSPGPHPHYPPAVSSPAPHPPPGPRPGFHPGAPGTPQSHTGPGPVPHTPQPVSTPAPITETATPVAQTPQPSGRKKGQRKGTGLSTTGYTIFSASVNKTVIFKISPCFFKKSIKYSSKFTNYLKIISPRKKF